MSFVVLDGVDGCGKSTQARLLVERLAAAGRIARHLREPGSTRVGEALRALLLDPELDLQPDVEVLLFAAARRQLLAELPCQRLHHAWSAALVPVVVQEEVAACFGKGCPKGKGNGKKKNACWCLL